MKHIKKSMFISTVLMVVMLIAALSTATFAWYTSNNSVASTSTKVGAAESKSANIGIGWYKTAIASTIEFEALVDSTNKGGMYPLAPITYYSAATAAVENASKPTRDYYIAVPNTASTGFIADGFDPSNFDTEEDPVEGNQNYLRIVNIAATETAGEYIANGSVVKAKSAYVHNVESETKVITNLVTGTTAGTLTGNYDIVYTSIKYAYNNSINQVADAPEADDIITLDAGVYTVATPATNTTACYTVYDVYKVVATGGAETVPAFNAGSKDISQMLAYSITGKACYPDTYVVAYIEYKAVPFNSVSAPADLTKIQAMDTTANAFIGYAADQADTANDGDIFKTAAFAEPFLIDSDVNWNSAGFAYLYKIYESTAPSAELQTPAANENTLPNNVGSFLFGESTVDANGYFKSTSSSNITAQMFYNNSAATEADRYSPAKTPALISTRDTTVSRNSQGYFFVVNNATDDDAIVSNLKVSLNVSGDNADLLRIAVFKNGLYYGTLGKTAATHFGSIIEGANIDDMPTYNAVTSASGIDLGALAPGSSNAFEIRLVAWFDGKGLDDTAAGKNCTFTLSFEA